MEDCDASITTANTQTCQDVVVETDRRIKLLRSAMIVPVPDADNMVSTQASCDLIFVTGGNSQYTQSSGNAPCCTAFSAPAGSQSQRLYIAHSHNGAPACSTKGSQESPFPLVDEFISAYITQRGREGRIRQWEYSDGLITYQIVGNRYCQNIGRQHKSNNIMLVGTADDPSHTAELLQSWSLTKGVAA
eukprot:TRINITY_DN2055_c0_g1_i5.p1 TRINITY_DN2055_c0_g1~~TRINITY_DN2055_c0_g1_i5.p1  ORF type:complete len:189 (-),score=31.69 TRINITY_DN2055_c0_g1_i5:1207-1773(-)